VLSLEQSVHIALAASESGHVMDALFDRSAAPAERFLRCPYTPRHYEPEFKYTLISYTSITCFYVMTIFYLGALLSLRTQLRV